MFSVGIVQVFLRRCLGVKYISDNVLTNFYSALYTKVLFVNNFEKKNNKGNYMYVKTHMGKVKTNLLLQTWNLQLYLLVKSTHTCPYSCLYFCYVTSCLLFWLCNWIILYMAAQAPLQLLPCCGVFEQFWVRWCWVDTRTMDRQVF